MVPPRGFAVSSANLSTNYSLALLSEYTHTLDSLPLDLSRNFADLRELDAVLSSSMSSITAKIHALTQMIEQGTAPKEERLWLLTEIAEEANRLKLGGEDKIRVACQGADNLKAHAQHLRTLSEHLPDFNPSTLNRKTTYPHVAARSFMPAAPLEGGRRRRGGFGSLLVSAPDPSPAKRKRVARDDDIDVTNMRSPKKDRVMDPPSRSRTVARAKKNERAVSPSESLVSVTSHVLSQANQGNANSSRVGANQSTTRAGNNNTVAANKRSRSTANNNNRGPTPVPIDQLPHHDHVAANGSSHNGNSSRRDHFNVPPSSSSHPSLPMPYHNSTGAIHSNNTGLHSHSPAYDTLPRGLSNAPDWNPLHAQQLEGPGMPVARSTSVLPVLPNIPVGTGVGTDGGATEAGDGDGDGEGDDKTYCFCNGVSYGEMIACDDTSCEKEWFHLACIGLAVPPDGTWFCDTCKGKRNAKRSNRGGKRRAANSRAGGKAA